MKRLWGFRKQFISITVIAAMLCGMTACQKKMPGRLDGKYSSSDVSSQALSSQTEEQESSQPESDEETAASATAKAKKYTTPPFKSGSYTMESSSVNEQFFYSGKSVVSFTRMTQTYTYAIKLTVKKDGSMTAVYTFKRIRTGYEDTDGAITADTNDKSGRNEDNAVYYDLIGQSFTVNISKDYKLTVKGIDAIHKKYPYTSDIVTNDNMKEVAADLFYKMSGSISQGSSWSLDQVGLTNTYTVSSIKDGSVYVNIKGKKLDLPEPYTSDGMKYTYKKREPLSGSLVIALDNRMIQEQSSYQENSGVIESGDKKYTFTESAASICNIKKN